MSTYTSGPIRENGHYLSCYTISAMDDGQHYWTVSAINLGRKGSRITRAGIAPDAWSAKLAAGAAQDALMGYPS